MDVRLFRRLVVILIFAAVASPALAQRAPSRAWLDLDETFDTPTQDPQTYSGTAVVFGELATASVSYPALSKTHRPAFGAGVGIYRGLGVGIRVAATERQAAPAALTVTIPDPVFFNRPHTGHLESPVERTERTLDLQVAYVLPIPTRLSVRVFAGRSRSTVTQSLIQNLTYRGPDAAGVVTLDTVTQRTSKGYAWGSLVGVDAGVFLLRNVGVGVQLVHRNVEIPAESEPFTGQPFVLSPHRTQFAGGLRLRF
jgi:hypothetical protein